MGEELKVSIEDLPTLNYVFVFLNTLCSYRDPKICGPRLAQMFELKELSLTILRLRMSRKMAMVAVSFSIHNLVLRFSQALHVNQFELMCAVFRSRVSNTLVEFLSLQMEV